MNRIAVTSTNISSVGYDASTMTLEIEFTSGTVYQYFDCPDSIYQQFISAESAGKFFYQNIRDNYRFAKQ